MLAIIFCLTTCVAAQMPLDLATLPIPNWPSPWIPRPEERCLPGWTLLRIVCAARSPPGRRFRSICRPPGEIIGEMRGRLHMPGAVIEGECPQHTACMRRPPTDPVEIDVSMQTPSTLTAAGAPAFTEFLPAGEWPEGLDDIMSVLFEANQVDHSARKKVNPPHAFGDLQNSSPTAAEDQKDSTKPGKRKRPKQAPPKKMKPRRSGHGASIDCVPLAEGETIYGLYTKERERKHAARRPVGTSDVAMSSTAAPRPPRPLRRPYRRRRPSTWPRVSIDALELPDREQELPLGGSQDCQDLASTSTSALPAAAAVGVASSSASLADLPNLDTLDDTAWFADDHFYGCLLQAGTSESIEP